MLTITREKFENTSFDELMEMLYNEREDITTYEMLKDFAMEHIKNDCLHIATFILNAMYDSGSHFPYDTEWYRYDYSMGTLMKPKELNTKNDIEDFFDIEEY